MESDQSTPGMTRERWAGLAFGVYLIGAACYAVIVLGRDLWFFADDWAFATIDGLPSPLIAHNGHWVFLPALAFRSLYSVFGATTYLPYLMLSVGLHCLVVALVRVVMRRSGVGPWTATLTAATLVLFGAEGTNYLWAFQISLTLPLALGLAALILLDRDGPLDKRALLATVALIAAVMSSGVGLVMAGVAFLATAPRRGLWPAIGVTAPPLALYVLWRLVSAPAPSAPPKGISTLGPWIVSATTALWRSDWLIALVAAGVLIPAAIGIVWLFGSLGRDWIRLAQPIALTLGAGAMVVVTWLGRGGLGAEEAGAERYTYVELALLLPLIAVGISEFGRRTKLVALPLVLLAGVVVAQSVTIQPSALHRAAAAQLRLLFPAIAAAPLADDVPQDLHPDSGAFVNAGDVTVGWLRQEAARGALPAPANADTDALVLSRLAVEPQPDPPSDAPDACRTIAPGEELGTDLGQLIEIRAPSSITQMVSISIRPDGSATATNRDLLASDGRVTVAVRLPDITIGVPAGARDPLQFCS